jgi:uncharacterized protein YciI
MARRVVAAAHQFDCANGVSIMKKMSFEAKLLAASTLMACAMAANAATLGDFDCSKKVVALYQPGPNWSQFRERLAEHLDFIKAKMEQKVLDYGAPMSDGSGKPIGGLFIYDAQDLDTVAKLVDEDTFVKERVVVYSIARWGMCQGKAARN